MYCNHMDFNNNAKCEQVCIIVWYNVVRYKYHCDFKTKLCDEKYIELRCTI